MKPVIQIDDVIREMTDKEFADYQEMIAAAEPVNLDTETTQE
jgi:hypothetical protein